MLGGRRWLRLRGALLPLVDVGGVLDAAVEETQERLRVVVVGDGSQRVGLVVDEIGDPAEIVVKPLGTLLSGITELAGATVMGDGRIAYILDVTRLAARDGLDGSSAGAQDRVEEEAQVSEKQDVIVARRGDVRLAFAVGDVDRLERFSVQDFENALGRCVVQYRGSLLPISQPDPSGYVIVCRKPDGGTVGVGVESIDDVADVQIDEDGTVVVDGRVADRVIIEEVWA